MSDELYKNLDEKIDKAIENMVSEDELNNSDTKIIGELIDIKKDIANIEYWKTKEDMINMRYSAGRSGSYGTRGESYGARGRDSRGRYTGRSGSYKGYDMIDDMSENYGAYSEGKEMYGSDSDTMKSLEYMLQSVYDFMCMLEEEAGSQEEMDMIKHYARKISEM